MPRVPDNCANPIFCGIAAKWVEQAEDRGWASATTYKKAFNSLKICPMPFEHPAEVIVCNGWGDKMVAKLTEAYERYCEENGLPIPENTTWKKTKKKKNGVTAADLNGGSESPSPKKKTRKPKEYIPARRSGPYAILIALYRSGIRSGVGNRYLSKDEVIELAQPFCDSSFTESDRGSFYTAWNSMKTLCEKEYCHQKGRPHKFALTDQGEELGEKLHLQLVAEENGEEPPTFGSQKTAAPKPAKAKPAVKAGTKRHLYSDDEEPVDEDDRIMRAGRRLERESVSPEPTRRTKARTTTTRTSTTSRVKPSARPSRSATYEEPVDEDDRIMQAQRRLDRRGEIDASPQPLSGSVFRGQNASTLFSDMAPLSPPKQKFPGLGSRLGAEPSKTMPPPATFKASEPIVLDSSEDEKIIPKSPKKKVGPENNFGVPRKETVPRPRVQPDGTLRDPTPAPAAPRASKSSVPPPTISRTASVSESKPAFPDFTPLMFPPRSFTVHLILDNREKSSRNAPDHIQETMLRLHQLQAMTRPLSLGDVQWIAKHKETGQEVVLDFIVERKRMDDLVSSIKDGRLREQKFRLKRSGISSVIYIIENYSSRVGTERLMGNGASFGVPVEAIESTISGMQVNDDIFVKRTDRIEETVRYLATITKFLEDKLYNSNEPLYYLPTSILDSKTYPDLCEHLAKTQPGRKYHVDFESFNSMMGKGATSTLRDVFIKMLMVTKGVSAEKAAHIQSVYKVPAKLLQAYHDLDGDWEAQKNMLANTCGGVIGRKAIGKALSEKIAQVWARGDEDEEDEEGEEEDT
ncbi:ERCC4-domain-containing protein [Ascobolus immersus RN42]|uniref:Crossover junction endonuclease MUS81 n=1 Tax=Ascobolus immersus RN42 TaxID=1160509 RepID=A0A3N4I5X8_ASCIM|nr:ERCC4-domain-containing protein [Ascobolus immersus RN42]